MQALQQILGVIVLLAAIAPVAMAGGQMIAAFMMGKHAFQWAGITLLTMLLLVGAGLLLLRIVMPTLAGMASNWLVSIVSAFVLLAPPWSAWVVGKRWLRNKDVLEGGTLPRPLK
jgi:hypothetical protein